MGEAETMRAWQYTTIINGSLPQSLKVLESTPFPKPKRDQHLIKVNYVCLNPVDHKPAESPLVRRLLVPNPATPGIDFSGTIVKPASGSDLKPGDKVFGVGPSPFAGGCLAEYAVAGKDSTVRVPTGLSQLDASTIGVAGLTAWQSILSHKPKRVFINGGSGGTGVFGIQLCKASGINVTVSCSTRNVEFCKSLGADEVIDYTKTKSIADDLVKEPTKYDHVVDNVMADLDLYWKAHTFTEPGSKYIVVAGSPTLKYMMQSLQLKIPSWLGGGRRSASGMLAATDTTQLAQIGEWMKEGKIKAVVDERFTFENATKAFEKLKTNRARGKVVVEVAAD